MLAVRGSLGLRSVLGNVQVDPRATQTASAFAIDGQLGVEGTVSFVHYELTGIYTRYAVDFGYPRAAYRAQCSCRATRR